MQSRQNIHIQNIFPFLIPRIYIDLNIYIQKIYSSSNYIGAPEHLYPNHNIIRIRMRKIRQKIYIKYDSIPIPRSYII